MVRALTSRLSNATLSFSGMAPALGAELCDLVLMMLDSLRKFWVAQGEKRELLQLPGEDEEPQASKCQHRRQIPQVRPRVGRKFRAGHPEKVDEAHENEPESDPGQEFRVAFEVAREQQEEGHEEVKNEHEDGDNAPLAVQTRVVEGDLLRLIAGPNDEQLGEAEISPEHHEGQQ